eukprot:Lankesteria_metandrocarpae@DN3010_c0_g1_i1.p1
MAAVEVGQKDTAYFVGTDVFWNPDGSVYHLGTKVGEVAPRVIVVDLLRHAQVVASHFDKVHHEIHSDRLMHTYTGTYKGKLLTVIAIGYGAPMMDFLMREATLCCDGALAVVYLGICGVLRSSTGTDIQPTVCIASEGATCSFTNHYALAKANDYTSYDLAKTESLFINTPSLFGDATLHANIHKKLIANNVSRVTTGKFCSVESLPSQLEPDNSFEVNNDSTGIDTRVGSANFVDCISHQLFYLAGRRRAACKVASCCLGVPLSATESNFLSEHEERQHFFVVGGLCMDVLNEIADL